MDFQTRIKSHFDESFKAHIDSLQTLSVPLEKAINIMSSCILSGHKVLACGNGGSAADAQHFVAELVGRFERERIGFPAFSLTSDTSILTAVSNDYGYEDVFARQVSALGVQSDVLVGISTSGNSPNVVEAIRAAHEKQMPVIALTGRDGGEIRKILTNDDVELCVPSSRTMRIQEVHILLLHILCDGFDALYMGD
ncbi:phosphoheptose isomerase [Taylorella equigenitalis]|uniref:Phosphoheptose isomerase n=2 Tax=Taylorella equigenitalis TaxID=29575 RepID=A0A654KH57_TAYEM|nr:phosphoheptose isomerase [Taylorella equigenitalis]ADU91783.1 Phosphoheptose isomerase [Taylorella equigenitalis MCE9]AFN35348.1 putative phosphoheptose isomerase [Taylorella equigenitalis ATCC 35865]ASY30009.1 phosphoheptose isomerase [Taylorella equigenitalis]ASY37314.1 phosphoheptose isomerase [Taylorella equigenitalis]ASY38780.1 phosphoheptose isomerase [Taylorella equigenitalis]